MIAGAGAALAQAVEALTQAAGRWAEQHRLTWRAVALDNRRDSPVRRIEIGTRDRRLTVLLVAGLRLTEAQSDEARSPRGRVVAFWPGDDEDANLGTRDSLITALEELERRSPRSRLRIPLAVFTAPAIQDASCVAKDVQARSSPWGGDSLLRARFLHLQWFDSRTMSDGLKISVIEWMLVVTGCLGGPKWRQVRTALPGRLHTEVLEALRELVRSCPVRLLVQVGEAIRKSGWAAIQIAGCAAAILLVGGLIVLDCQHRDRQRLSREAALAQIRQYALSGQAGKTASAAKSLASHDASPRSVVDRVDQMGRQHMVRARHMADQGGDRDLANAARANEQAALLLQAVCPLGGPNEWFLAANAWENAALCHYRAQEYGGVHRCLRQRGGGLPASVPCLL